MKKWQWFCIVLQIIGCGGMGIHLFLFDGISNPTWILTVFALIFGIGLVGNLIVSLCRVWKERKNTQGI